MKAQVNFDSLGGGGSSGTVTTTASTDSEPIKTGLGNNLKCFTAVAYDSATADRVQSLVYTVDKAGKYTMSIGNLTSNTQDIGSAISGTYATQSSMIKSISNGDVVITGASHSNYGNATWYWQAQ